MYPQTSQVVSIPNWNSNQTYNASDTVMLPISISSHYPIQKIYIYGNNGILGTLAGNQTYFKFNVANIYSLSSTNTIRVEILDSIYDRADTTVTLNANVNQSGQ